VRSGARWAWVLAVLAIAVALSVGYRLRPGAESKGANEPEAGISAGPADPRPADDGVTRGDREPCTYEGVVLDAESRTPIPEAWVGLLLADAVEPGESPVALRVRTDRDGRFCFEDSFPAGKYVVGVATEDEIYESWQDLRLSSDLPETILIGKSAEAGPKAVLVGRVFGPDGAPLEADLRVHAYSALFFGGLSAASSDDLLGSRVLARQKTVKGPEFRIDGRLPGTYEIKVGDGDPAADEDRWVEQLVALSAGENEVEFHLDQGAGVRGNILLSGRPRQGTRVVASQGLDGGMRFVQEKSAVTDEDGDFYIRFLTPGPKRVTVDTGGERSLAKARPWMIDLEPGDVVDVGSVDLAPVARVSVEVRDEGGLPIEGAKVVMFQGELRADATTSTDGDARVWLHEFGSYDLLVTKPGFERVWWSGDDAVHLDSRNAAPEVAVTLVEIGRGTLAVSVDLSGDAHLSVLKEGRLVGMYSSIEGVDSYGFGDLAKGSYELLLIRGDRYYRQQVDVYEDVEIELAPEAWEAGRTVDGQVFGHDGTPRVGVDVSLVVAPGDSRIWSIRSATTGAEGRFSFRGIPHDIDVWLRVATEPAIRVTSDAMGGIMLD